MYVHCTPLDRRTRGRGSVKSVTCSGDIERYAAGGTQGACRAYEAVCARHRGSSPTRAAWGSSRIRYLLRAASATVSVSRPDGPNRSASWCEWSSIAKMKQRNSAGLP